MLHFLYLFLRIVLFTTFESSASSIDPSVFTVIAIDEMKFLFKHESIFSIPAWSNGVRNSFLTLT